MKRLQTILFALILLLPLNIDAQKQTLTAQQDSLLQQVEIGLLTCEPFHEIYSLYGHTGIRVYDRATGKDVVVNWGVFDMNQSWFALKFMFGITDYWMAIQPTREFLDEYSHFHCGVLEQVINLSSEDKARILQALAINAQPGNQQYRYNFLYDNCTTRARDIILDNIESNHTFLPFRGGAGGEAPTLRSEIHQWNSGHPWYRWGNDILLGVKADMPISRQQQEFLPDTLRKDFDRSGLVKKTVWLLPPQYVPAHVSFMERMLLGPWVIVWVTIIILLLARYTRWGYILKGLLYEALGIVGLILTAMIFSQHPTVSLNLQLLVFNPLWLWLGFKEFKKFKSSKVQKLYAFLLLLSLPLGTLLQHFAEGVVGLALVLLIDILKDIQTKKTIKHPSL